MRTHLTGKWWHERDLMTGKKRRRLMTACGMPVNNPVFGSKMKHTRDAGKVTCGRCGSTRLYAAKATEDSNG